MVNVFHHDPVLVKIRFSAMSDQAFLGCLVALDDENICPSSQLTTPAAECSIWRSLGLKHKFRAYEAASRRREEMELKMQREREREAARIALQKMEKTVEIEQNLDIQR
ncbi:hypothetical protein NC651_026021 [Populus alba x Populus x berolinensis]|nr:hypothetical protein NC651_026021 [Populus alba x Populus x berolinensis]